VLQSNSGESINAFSLFGGDQEVKINEINMEIEGDRDNVSP
jgi:hypothetical protein